MEPRIGDGENWTNGKFGKLNKWKICISGFLSAERSPCINVLMHEMEARMGDIGKLEPKENGDGKNWINGKFASLDY